MKADRIQSRTVFNDVLYAQCWEDPSIDRKAFAISPHDVLFTITSGGCNALAFLLDDPKHVIALDLNPHQNHILELKAAAVRTLSYGELLEFTGVIPSRQREALYHKLVDDLSVEAKRFWDGHPEHIQQGILNCGKFERYIQLLGGLTRAIVGQKTVHAFFGSRSTEERRMLYERHWNTLPWKLFTRAFLSRRCMSFFFDAAFFAQLEENLSFGPHFEGRIRHALLDLTPSESPFLSYALLGFFYDHRSLPLYLREENVPLVRSRLDRLTLVSDDCASFFQSRPASSISRFNFTNIFEWMSDADFESLLRETIRVATDGAVMTYRNLLVPRSHPTSLDSQISSRPDDARRLHDQDLSFLYRSYVIEDIRHRRQRHVYRHLSHIESV